MIENKEIIQTITDGQMLINIFVIWLARYNWNMLIISKIMYNETKIITQQSLLKIMDAAMFVLVAYTYVMYSVHGIVYQFVMNNTEWIALLIVVETIALVTSNLNLEKVLEKATTYQKTLIIIILLSELVVLWDFLRKIGVF